MANIYNIWFPDHDVLGFYLVTEPTGFQGPLRSWLHGSEGPWVHGLLSGIAIAPLLQVGGELVRAGPEGVSESGLRCLGRSLQVPGRSVRQLLSDPEMCTH